MSYSRDIGQTRFATLPYSAINSYQYYVLKKTQLVSFLKEFDFVISITQFKHACLITEKTARDHGWSIFPNNYFAK